MNKLITVCRYFTNAALAAAAFSRKAKRKNIITMQIDDYTALINRLYEAEEQIKKLELNPITGLRKQHIDQTRQAALMFGRQHEIAEALHHSDLANYAYQCDGRRLRYLYVNFILDTEDEKSIENYLRFYEISKHAFRCGGRWNSR
jgi:hypothetical protein